MMHVTSLVVYFYNKYSQLYIYKIDTCIFPIDTCIFSLVEFYRLEDLMDKIRERKLWLPTFAILQNQYNITILFSCNITIVKFVKLQTWYLFVC